MKALSTLHPPAHSALFISSIGELVIGEKGKFRLCFSVPSFIIFNTWLLNEWTLFDCQSNKFVGSMYVFVWEVKVLFIVSDIQILAPQEKMQDSCISLGISSIQFQLAS